MRVGDVIERIEEEPVASLEDFRRAMEGVEGLRRFLVTARRGAETKFLLVKPGARAADDDVTDDAGQVALPR
jgi:S1-C subfamily serine protease